MKKHLKNISLVLSGVVLGVVVSFSGEISAATSKLLGGKVGKVMTVSLDDKKIGDAPVIGGTSYVPVRTAANELGLEVAVEGNEIKLTTPEEMKEPEVTPPVEQPGEEPVVVDDAKVKEIEIKIDQVKRKIASSKTSLASKEKELEAAKNVVAAGSTGFVNVVDSLQESYDESVQYIADQEKELSTLESQLAALK
ncbi:hypothetical protein [Paenibacillus amylolyticus]|uniref:hypothetical protein n=1 Tax=Paenibacillus amylolyticus TaxID=1451 RepID=UPI000B83F848|nr:hypothetical protein [Paenibacillus amylolyticus]